MMVWLTNPLGWRVLMIGHTGYTDSCTGGFFSRFPVPMVLLSPDGQQDSQVYVCQFNTWLTTRSSARRQDGAIQPNLSSYLQSQYSINLNVPLLNFFPHPSPYSVKKSSQSMDSIQLLISNPSPP